MTSRDDAEVELDVAARRLGIEIPEDLRKGVLRGYRGLREMTALLRRAEAEQRYELGGGEGTGIACLTRREDARHPPSCTN